MEKCGDCFLDVDSEGCCKEEYYSRDSADSYIIMKASSNFHQCSLLDLDVCATLAVNCV